MYLNIKLMLLQEISEDYSNNFAFLIGIYKSARILHNVRAFQRVFVLILQLVVFFVLCRLKRCISQIIQNSNFQLSECLICIA